MPFNYKTPRNGIRPNFLGYMRVSKDDDLTGSHTFVTQEMRIREHLDRVCGENKYDLELFKDDGISGALSFRKARGQSKVRPALQQLVERIDTDSYDALMIYSQSRLFRNLRGLVELVEDVLIPNSTALLSVTENIDISTDDGIAMLQVKGSFDDFNRKVIASRNRDAAATARQLGYYVGQVPYGWDWALKRRSERPRILPIEEHRETLLWMRERYLAGWNANKIAGELNSRGVPPASHAQRWAKKLEACATTLWTGTEVYRLLSCPTHAGLIQDPVLLETAEKRARLAGEVLPSHLKSWKRKFARQRDKSKGHWNHSLEPIHLALGQLLAAGFPLENLEVDDPATPAELERWQRWAQRGYRYGRHFEHRLWEPEDFEVILSTHDERMKKFGTVTARSDNPHLLAGLIHCARCGKRLYARGSSEKGYLTYNCDNGMGAGQKTCPGLSVRGEYVEVEVVKELERVAAMPDLRQLISGQEAALERSKAWSKAQVPDETKALRGQLEKLDKRQKRFEEMYADGDLSRERYRERKAEIDAKRAPLQAKWREHEAHLQSQGQRELQAAALMESLEHFSQEWEHLDFDEKKQALSVVLDKLEADRIGRDIKLRLKIHLLPEREITIPYRTNQGKSRSHSHPLHLITNTELAYLHLVNQGMSEADIMKHWDLRAGSVKSYAKRIRKRFRDAALRETAIREAELVGVAPSQIPSGTSQSAASGSTQSELTSLSLQALAELSIEAIAELVKPRIEEVLDQLKVGPKNKNGTEAQGGRVVDGETVPFISGVLMEAFVLFASGASTGDVANRLGLSHIAAQGRRSKILTRMGTPRMLDAVEKARKWGILKDIA